MGYNFASDLATAPELNYRAQISLHLTSNHYPPVPTSMVTPCIEAIDACIQDEPDTLIDLPDGVLWRNQEQAPAWAIVEGHHLQAWLEYDEYEEEE